MPIRSQQKPPARRARGASQIYLQRARASSNSARSMKKSAQNHTEAISDTFEALHRPKRKRNAAPKQRIMLKSRIPHSSPKGGGRNSGVSRPAGGSTAEAYAAGAENSQLETLQMRYRLIHADNRKLKSDNRYLHHKTQDLRDELQQKKRVCNELSKSEKRLQQRLNILNGELEKQRGINAQRTEDNQMLKNRLKVMDNMHKRKVADLYRTIRQSSKADGRLDPRASFESSDVTNSLRVQVKEAHDQLEIRTKELQDEKHKRNTAIDELQSQYAKDRARLQEALHSQSAELKDERTKYQESKVTIHRLKRELDTLKAQVGEGSSSRATKNLKKTIAKLNEEIEEHNRESAKLKLSVRNISTKNEDSLRRLKYALKDLEETRATMNEEREKYSQQIQELRTDTINEKKERRKMEAKYESLRDMTNASGGGSVQMPSDMNLDKFAQERAKFQDMEKKYREALKQTNKRMKENERQNHKTKALYQKLIKEKGELENKSLSQEMELDHLRDLCSELETENASLNKKVGELTKEQQRLDAISESDDKVKALNQENMKLMRTLSDMQENSEFSSAASNTIQKVKKILESEPQLKGFDVEKAVKVLAQQARVLRQSQNRLENKLREESIKYEQEKIKLQNQLEAVNEELQDMKFAVENATGSSTDAEKRIQDLETEKRIMNERLLQYEQTVLLSGDGSSTRIVALEEQIETLERQKEDIAKEYADRMVEWESERISQETNDVSVRSMIFALKREIESSTREKEGMEHELMLYKQRFEDLQRLLAEEGYQIEVQMDDAEFYEEQDGRGGAPGAFMEGYAMEDEGDDEEAEEFMDEYFEKLRDKLRDELVGHVATSSELEDVEYVLSKIEILGLRNESIEVKKLRPEDIKAATNIKKQFDALPVLEGYLEKYSPNAFAGWQRRWVVVRDYYLFWAKKEVVLENNASPLGSKNKSKFVNHIPLLTVQKIVADAKEAGKFVVKGQDRKSGDVRDYIWRIPKTHGVKERTTWIEGLERHISHLQLCMQWVTTARSLNKSSASRQSIRYASSPPRNIRSKRSSQFSSGISMNKPSPSESGGSPIPLNSQSPRGTTDMMKLGSYSRSHVTD